ncbi:MAG: hypothetical protein AVDCRST_MAG67-2682, partial [uncultured Solirubrobacteraceae bacterium]
GHVPHEQAHTARQVRKGQGAHRQGAVDRQRPEEPRKARHGPRQGRRADRRRQAEAGREARRQGRRLHGCAGHRRQRSGHHPDAAGADDITAHGGQLRRRRGPSEGRL